MKMKKILILDTIDILKMDSEKLGEIIKRKTKDGYKILQLLRINKEKKYFTLVR